MKTTQYTPAPWARNIPPAWKYPIYDEKNHNKIAYIIKDACISEAEQEANLNLIAAAPELLEALEKVMATNDAICNLLSTAYDRLTDNDMMPPNNALKTWLKQAEHVLKRDWQDQARAAISKAKGE